MPPLEKYAFMWGMIGSVLQGLYAVWRQVSQRQFRRGWIAWYLALPVIGAILGALMYMAIQFGVVATTQSGIRNDTVLLLAALAGFSWKWSVGILENVEKLFKAGTESTSQSQ
jgi:type II secretory pathway component PulF